MSLSKATLSAHPLPMLSLGKPKFPYMDSIPLSGPRLVGPSIQCQAFRSKEVIVHANRSLLSESVLKGPQIVSNLFLSRTTTRHATETQSAAAICASAFNVRCGAAAETQTVLRKSTNGIVSPPGKDMLPMLDDGGSGFRGTGFTPYYRGDDGGSGSGGGGGGFSMTGEFPWGDFWFFIFLFLLRFLIMNIIGEGPFNYKYKDGRKKPIRRFL